MSLNKKALWIGVGLMSLLSSFEVRADDLAGRPFCNRYANTANAAYEDNVNSKCGFSDGRWQNNFDAHFSWCLQQTENTAQGEEDARNTLLAQCQSKDAPQQGITNGDDNDQLVSDAQVDLSPDAYVCFYPEPDYGGKKSCFTQDWSDASKPARKEYRVTKEFDNRFSSVKVGAGITARGCKDPGETKYYCKRFVGDIPYLGDDWNDVISMVTVGKFSKVYPKPIAREPDFTVAYSLDDENHLTNSKDLIDSIRPSICLYSAENYGGDEKCFGGEGPLDTDQDGWAEKTVSYRIGLGYTLCLERPASKPKPEGQDYDSATSIGNCELPYGEGAAFASLKAISKFKGNFRGFHIERNAKYKRYM